jgi:ParB family chromosome partitioning protein
MPSTLPLSSLVPSKKNPRKTKPDRDAHARLVASIATHGLLHPLVVTPIGNGSPKRYAVIAGNRRLAALHEVYAERPAAKVSVIIRTLSADEAHSLSLGENFAREAMHPLDEAIAFATLASAKGKEADSIASEFGVTRRYVMQRMRLASLARPIAAAYRAGTIDTATAEAFSAVPAGQQAEIWKQLNGSTCDAATVRHLIHSVWINAEKALFDVSSLPAEAVSSDLFSAEVLVERKAFLQAQQQAVEARQQALAAEGWNEVVVTDRESIRDRLWSMDKVVPRYDPPVERRIAALQRKLDQFDRRAGKLKFNHPDQPKLRSRMEALERRAVELVSGATPRYDDDVRKAATVYLIVDADGSVHEERRLPRPKPADESSGRNGATARPDRRGTETKSTANDLSDGQRGTLLAAHAYAVRDAVLGDPHVGKALTAMALHAQLRSPAIALRAEPNASTLLAEHNEAFRSEARQRMTRQWSQLKPLTQGRAMSDVEVFESLVAMSDKELDRLIALLTAELLSHGAQRPNELLCHLAERLKVDVRTDWTPDADWLRAYRKGQLVDLIVTLCGKVATPASDAKHGELVAKLGGMFASARSGNLGENARASACNAWLPAGVALGAPTSTK